MYDLTNFAPSELGLPARFAEFRPVQLDAITAICNSSKRVFLAGLPTGVGKSLIAMACAKVLGGRSVIVTATKGLQEQYRSDFAECGLVDVRGKANYLCAKDRLHTCRIGERLNCSYTGGHGCTYECARDIARAKDSVLTNYAYWVRSLEYPEKGLILPDSPVDLLVLDEGHRAPEELSRCLQTTLREKWLLETRLRYPKDEEDISVWVKWGFANSEYVNALLLEALGEFRRNHTPRLRQKVQDLEDLQEAIESICRINANLWICELRKGTQYGRVWDFQPIWPASFSERYLFAGVPKVLILSATLRPMTAGLLGLDSMQSEFREWGRVFPPQRAPVYHYSPGARTSLRHDSSEEDLDRWVGRIDDILERRADRKGIIHTVSYARQQRLLGSSRWRSRFIANDAEPDSPSAAEVVKKFKASDEPLVLVSPSVGTGWDFPGTDAEFQIIAKVPFPPINSKIMQARTAKNRRYPAYLAMQELVQAAGRIVRSTEDRGETFIVDDAVQWFYWQNRALTPSWFQYRKIQEVPEAPPKLTATSMYTSA